MKAVIFDLDGTLLDTLADLAAATNQALTKHQYPALPPTAYRHLVGRGNEHLCRHAAAQASGQDPGLIPPGQVQSLLDDFKACYQACWHQQTRPYPQIDWLIRKLQQQPLRLAVLSNKLDTFTRKIVAHYFPGQPFAQVSGMRPEWPGKPDPSLALHLCRLMGVVPEETVFIGDSGLDMQTAVRGRFYPIGVTWGFRDRDELQANGAACLADDPAACLEIILRLLACNKKVCS